MLNALGTVFISEQNFLEAQQAFDQATLVFRSLNKPLCLAQALHNLGIALVEEHRYSRAAQALAESVRIRQGRDLPAASTLLILGIAQAKAGEYSEAAHALEEAFAHGQVLALTEL